MFNATHEIKAGYGYWDATQYPVGGCFRRAEKTAGLPVVAQGEPQRFQGFGYLVKFIDQAGRILWAGESAFRPLD